MNAMFQRIKIRDNPATVKRKIHQASSPMFVREFTQNALEAARAAGPFGRVKWWEFTEGDYRKLCVWNNGRGMTADELINVMDLFSSGGDKSQAADENFGIGAKITGLKASPLGVLWRSCKHGRVSQIYLGWMDGEPGFDPPEDVTDLYTNTTLKDFDLDLYKRIGDCALLDFEWTMAVFFGRTETQDTVVDPLGDGSPAGGRSYWLPKCINRRYYDFGMLRVTAICDRGDAHDRQSRTCRGLYHLDVEREESVERPFGLIRYCLLPSGKTQSAEDAKGYGGHGVLVFRNEIYDGLFDGHWGIHGRRYGVIAGANRVAIDVVLNNDFSATPNEQRNLLERELDRGERQPIYLNDFEEDIYCFMPQFLRDFISEEDAKKQLGSDKSRKAIKQMMQDMGLTVKREADGGEQLAEESGIGDADVTQTAIGRVDGPGPSPGPSHSQPRIRSTRPPYKRGVPVKTGVEKNLTSEPKIEWDENRGEVPTTIGFYDSATHTIILNERYQVLDRVVDSVISSGIPDFYRDRVREEAKAQIEIAAARHVLWALAQVSTHAWNISQQQSAVTPESLTASLGFYRTHYAAVEVQCRQFKHIK